MDNFYFDSGISGVISGIKPISGFFIVTVDPPKRYISGDISFVAADI